ncbi:MAG: GspE/PulE family protein [bacterium]
MSQLNDQKIKEILLSETYISEQDLKDAEEYFVKHGQEPLIDYLLAEGIISKDLLGQAIAEYYQVRYLDLSREKIDEEIVKLIPESVARSQGVVAFSRTEKGVKVAMTDPGEIEIKDFVAKKLGENVIIYYTTEHDMQDLLAVYRESLQNNFGGILKQLENQELSREKRDQSIVEIVDMLLQYGYQSKASDIHIEPYENEVLVRFRVDGMMHDALKVPKDLSELILTRVKILSRMRTDEHRSAQDGKIRFKVGSENMDVRVSVVPVTQGENVVMRLLSARNRRFSLSDLGMSASDLKKVKDSIKHPHGMILVTGPTGSGKTTSLYAMLKVLNKRNVNIATIEDPVEYDIESISQIQVNTKTNLTFAKGLRAIVRQDPDIIMVGEIRDEETAGIAVNSALTGHLVLSTLHTNDAATTLPRLLDMDVEPFLVASTINVVIAQRLVRKICPKCRSSHELSSDELKVIEESVNIKQVFKNKGYKSLKGLRLYRGEGCRLCAQTGYSGRIGIFEVLEMSEPIKSLILNHASSDQIQVEARKQGMSTMFEDGVDKALSGVTSFAEVLRVSRE